MTDFRNALRKEVGKIENQIDGYLEKIADAASETAVIAYERRIDKLEATKLKVQGQLENACLPHATAADFLEPAMQFFSSPWKIRKTGRQDLRRLVLRLAFLEPLAYCREIGPRTPKTTLPFNTLGGKFCSDAAYGGGGGTRTLDLRIMSPAL